MKKKIGVIYSSFNNYELLENEVIKRINFDNYPVINIDDHSEKKNQDYGAKICRANNIYYEINSKKGLQFAVDQGIQYLTNKFNTEWVICLQQDIYPLEKKFFLDFERRIESLKERDKIGAIGFNIISEDDIYMKPTIINDYKKGLRPKGLLGSLPLSGSKNNFYNLKIKNQIKYILHSLINSNNSKNSKLDLLGQTRNFCPYGIKNFNKISKLYSGICAIDIPTWAAIAINTKNWKKYIKPRDGYIFHIWFPDIAFQFLNNNIWLAVDTELYLENKQKIKNKYGFHWSSAHAGKKEGLAHQVEKYGNHLKIFEDYWGFDFRNLNTYKKVKSLYNKTLIEAFWEHDYSKGPIKIF
jgi:hypothetical protein